MSRLLLAAAVLLLLGLGLKSALSRRAAAGPDPARPGPQDIEKDPKNKDLMRLFGSYVC